MIMFFGKIRIKLIFINLVMYNYKKMKKNEFQQLKFVNFIFEINDIFCRVLNVFVKDIGLIVQVYEN